MDHVRFYFSFRSPYAWLAFHQAPPALRELPVELELLPVFPPPDFPNDPAAVPNKLKYVVEQDIPRLSGAMGLPLEPLAQLDVDWMRPHAMWVYASDHGQAEAFGKGVFAARFSRGLDLADDATYVELARECQLDADATVGAASDESYRGRVMKGMMQGLEDGIFGVPYFAYRDERFWGHDRLPWLIRAICRDHDLAEPELAH